MSVPLLSVIIPVYNEEHRLGESIPGLVKYLRSQDYRSEIIVVDDGSSDATVRQVKELLGDFPHEVLEQGVNRGKGAAVKRGMLQGRGDYLLFTDADLSTPIREVEGFMKELKDNYDVVIGSRALEESKIDQHQPFLRELMGRVYNLCARALAFQGVKDSQCGFKCFRRDAGRDIFTRQKLERFSFDAEIVYLAQKSNYRLLEKAVEWNDSPQSRVNLLQDPMNMFMDLLRIRWIHR